MKSGKKKVINRGLPNVGSIIWSFNNGHDASLNQFDMATGETKHAEVEKLKNEKHAFWDRNITAHECRKMIDDIFNSLILEHGWEFPDHMVTRHTSLHADRSHFGNATIFHEIRAWLGENSYNPKFGKKMPSVGYTAMPSEIPHHAQHALSAYHGSPYKNAFVISTDGLGDGTYYAESSFKNNQLVEYWEPPLINPSSYCQTPRGNSRWTPREDSFCGCAQPFRQFGFLMLHHITPHHPYADVIDTLDYAGKLMGLSSIVQEPNRELVDLYKKIISSVDTFESWCQGKLGTVGNYQLRPNLGLGPDTIMHGRNCKERLPIWLEEEELGHAAALQTATNEASLEWVTSERLTAKIQEHDNNLVLCGGGALNVVANQYIREHTDYNIFVPPDPGDSGLSFGLSIWYAMKNGWKGYDYGKRPSRRFSGLKFNTQGMEEDTGKNVTLEEVSNLIKEGKIIGLIQGTIENGPRALGNRSIICDPSYPDMRDRINAKIKNREWYRPFAPVCRLEDAPKYFDSRTFDNLEHMSFTVDVKPEYQESFPSITHVDNTARLQTVTQESNLFLYDLLSIEKSVLLNTSFNVQGFPILNSWKDAKKILNETDLHHILYKDEGGNLILYS